MNTPSTLIGIITKLNIEMQQKLLVGIMHHDYTRRIMISLLVKKFLREN